MSEENKGEVLMRVEGASKKFCKSLKKSLWYGVCDMAAEMNPFSRSSGKKDSLRAGEFWAVDNVSFELRRGECLGLIGHNGAGKTTLLKMLNGLIKPDGGRIEMRGRVGALIALGAGFNPILTGRENIYINGSVLGLSKKEIEEKIEEIIEFAEMREFIDMPVQNYSSGMSVRLGFSIASSICPDILILDEVLAVGDIGFVVKSLNRVRKLAADSAVILVSHQMQFISYFCSRVIFMSRGRAALDTNDCGQAIDKYYQLIEAEKNDAGTMQASLQQLLLVQGKDILQGAEGTLRMSFTIEGNIRAASLYIYVMDQTMSAVICHPIRGKNGDSLVLGPGRHEIEVSLGKIDLVPGTYSFTFSLIEKNTRKLLLRSQGLHQFRVLADHAEFGHVVRPLNVSK